jgi:hypothetical protein
MEAGARATIDDPVLRRRLRSEFTPSYTRRTFTRPRPALISDFTERRYQQAPTPSISPQIVQHPDIPKPLSDIDSSSPQISVQSNSALTQAHIDSTKPIARRKATAFLKNLLTIRRKSKLQVALMALAISIILAGAYVSYLGLRANHVAVAQAAKLTQQANNAAKSSGSSTAPSTVKPSAAAVASYVVAPNLPRYIMIPRLGVNARVLSVGVNSQGALETPNNVHDRNPRYGDLFYKLTDQPPAVQVHQHENNPRSFFLLASIKIPLNSLVFDLDIRNNNQLVREGRLTA